VLLKDLCSHESLDAQFPAVAVGERLKVANRLLADHRLRVFQRRDGTQLIKLAGVGEAKCVRRCPCAAAWPLRARSDVWARASRRRGGRSWPTSLAR
jgi:hypothetical protein